MSDLAVSPVCVVPFDKLEFTPRFEFGHMAKVTEVIGAGECPCWHHHAQY